MLAPPEQAPAVHCSPAEQIVPQAPQFRGSRLSTTHVVPHNVSPTMHSAPPVPVSLVSSSHAPATHDAPGSQTLPQPPQWAGSRPVSTQAPAQLVRRTARLGAPTAAVAATTGHHAARDPHA